ncbi:hypothetical protein M413DRAFT_440706, partial [Hebeloma cylindrosporum]
MSRQAARVVVISVSRGHTVHLFYTTLLNATRCEQRHQRQSRTEFGVYVTFDHALGTGVLTSTKKVGNGR